MSLKTSTIDWKAVGILLLWLIALLWVLPIACLFAIAAVCSLNGMSYDSDLFSIFSDISYPLILFAMAFSKGINLNKTRAILAFILLFLIAPIMLIPFRVGYLQAASGGFYLEPLVNFGLMHQQFAGVFRSCQDSIGCSSIQFEWIGKEWLKNNMTFDFYSPFLIPIIDIFLSIGINLVCSYAIVTILMNEAKRLKLIISPKGLSHA